MASLYKHKITWVDIILGVLAISLFALCVYRAYNLSFTHDESSTYLHFRRSPILKFLTHSSMWGNANNHLLNTLLMQGSIDVFGSSDLSLRFPNIISFGFYMYAIVKLGKNLFKNPFVLLFFFIICCANPYAFDFFSLCRGYGLSMCFQMLAFSFVFDYLKNPSNKNLASILLSLFFMAFALFSTLLLIPVFLGALLSVLLLKNKLDRKHFFIATGFLLFCTIVFYVPVTALSGNGEFNFGEATFVESMQNFASYFFYNKPYLGNGISIVFLSLIIISGGLLIFKNISKRQIDLQISYEWFMVGSLSLLIIGLILSKLILGTLYPMERKTLLLFPYAYILLGLLLNVLEEVPYLKYSKFLICSFFVFHFFDAHQIEKTREWWYDYETKKIIQIIQKDTSNDVSLSVNWLFHPTASRYLELYNMNNVSLDKYTKSIADLERSDYFICIGSDYKKLKKDYNVHYENQSSIRLLKKKD